MYTSVAQAACFIKWTTRCLHGDRYVDTSSNQVMFTRLRLCCTCFIRYKDYFDIGQCDSFPRDERRRLNNLERDYSNRLNRATSANCMHM